MNQTEAESVKDLAKSTVEALGVITKRECLECEAKGEISREPTFQYSVPVECIVCSGTGKVRWKWEPKMGEWYFHEGIDRLTLVTNNKWIKALKIEYPNVEPTPILHWEEIERVLEGVGYWLDINKPLDSLLKKGWMGVSCAITKQENDESESIVFVKAKSRQEAVMRSVIQLGKEIDAKSK